MSNLDLIDWALVGYSALWILGLSILLAALGFADYRAGQGKIPLRKVLSGPDYQVAVNLGLLLFCLGLLGGSRTVWEQLAWAGLALAFGYQAWQAWRAWRAAPPAG